MTANEQIEDQAIMNLLYLCDDDILPNPAINPELLILQ
jgi:hypothetical protein